jgi:hypothetical protein
VRSEERERCIAIAESALREAARSYAGMYLQAPFSALTDEAAEELRIAACAYASAIQPPKKRRSTPPSRKTGGA